MAVVVRTVVGVGVVVRGPARCLGRARPDHEPRRRIGAPVDSLAMRLPARDADGAYIGEHDVEWGSRMDERGDQHVARDARETVQEQDHVGPALRFTMRAASAAAPNPLSMFTTPIPGAQALSIVRSAATPPKLAP